MQTVKENVTGFNGTVTGDVTFYPSSEVFTINNVSSFLLTPTLNIVSGFSFDMVVSVNGATITNYSLLEMNGVSINRTGNNIVIVINDATTTVSLIEDWYICLSVRYQNGVTSVRYSNTPFPSASAEVARATFDLPAGKIKMLEGAAGASLNICRGSSPRYDAVGYSIVYKAVKQVERKYWKREETEQPWTQPVLSANGTIGGDSFACAASSEYSTSYAWKAFDNDDTSLWSGSTAGSSAVPQWLEWYDPSGLKITQITFTSGDRGSTSFPSTTFIGGCVKDYIIQVSEDGNTWTDIYTGRNTSFSAKQSITASFTNEAFYKYWRIYISSVNDTRLSVSIWDISITATHIEETITPSTAEDYDFYTDETNYKGVNI